MAAVGLGEVLGCCSTGLSQTIFRAASAAFCAARSSALLDLFCGASSAAPSTPSEAVCGGGGVGGSALCCGWVLGCCSSGLSQTIFGAASAAFCAARSSALLNLICGASSTAPTKPALRTATAAVACAVGGGSEFVGGVCCGRGAGVWWATSLSQNIFDGVFSALCASRRPLHFCPDCGVSRSSISDPTSTTSATAQAAILPSGAVRTATEVCSNQSYGCLRGALLGSCHVCVCFLAGDSLSVRASLLAACC